jgi:uncharacterized Zn-binding protein involved in type VI secretion
MGTPYARVGDMHVCPMVNPGVPPIPHVGGPVVTPANPMVLVGGVPAAAAAAMCVCVGPPDSIVKGAPTKLVGGMPAASIGSMTAHGGSVVVGLPTVLVG